MGPRQLGGLLARDPGHRNCAPNFVARHCGSHATGQNEGRGQPKRQSCKTRIHGALFTIFLCQLCTSRLWKDEVSERQNLDEKEEG